MDKKQLTEADIRTKFFAVGREAEFRVEQNTAFARATKALHRADKGLGLMTAEDFLANMGKRAKAAQKRIRAAVAAKSKRATG